MQDEVNTKVVAIAIKGGKITAEVLKKALAKFIEEIEKAEKQASQPKTYRGKQSIKHLVEQNAAISNIEVTDGNIKSFERTANKYGIDYALKKDTSEQPPRYLVFFKGRDSAAAAQRLSLIHISHQKAVLHNGTHKMGRTGSDVQAIRLSGCAEAYATRRNPQIISRCRWLLRTSVG